MASGANGSSMVRVITFNSLFTCVYITLLTLVLFYYQHLYDIGKRRCLPFIGSLALAECLKLCLTYLNQDSPTIREKPSKAKKNYFRNKLKCILVMLTMIAIYYIIAVLFGAPLFVEQEETLMFSLLMTTLTVLPSCLNLGADLTITVLTGLTNFQGDLFIESIKRNICFTLLGAWLGAIVIPLDWDRPWQIWPIPCCLGAILGYVVSHIFVLVRLVPKFAKFFVKKTGKYGL